MLADEGLIPRARLMRGSEADDWVQVLVQQSTKLQALGVRDELYSALRRNAFSTDGMKLSEAEKAMLSEREVDKTLYELESAIAALRALPASSHKQRQKAFERDKAYLSRLEAQDSKRADIIHKLKAQRTPDENSR